MQLVDKKLWIEIGNLRYSDNWQKFKFNNRLHKDKIKANRFDTVSDNGGDVDLIWVSIERCVICSVRRLRRVVSPSIQRKPKTIVNVYLIILISVKYWIASDNW